MPYSKIKQLVRKSAKPQVGDIHPSNYLQEVINPLIKMLNESVYPNDRDLVLSLTGYTPRNKPEAFLAIFVSLHKHPTLAEHGDWKKMQSVYRKLFDACIDNPQDAAELDNILNVPENRLIKSWYQDFVKTMVKGGYVALDAAPKKSPSPSRRR